MADAVCVTLRVTEVEGDALLLAVDVDDMLCVPDNVSVPEELADCDWLGLSVSLGDPD